MKRSLLLTKLISVCFLLASCHSTSPPKTEATVAPVVEPKAISTAEPVASDTSKLVIQTPLSGAAGSDKGIRKDTIKQGVKPTAIIHASPEQAKIDSIKNAKKKK